MTLIAACNCRACAIELDGEPVFNGLCHCDSCRRRTGAPLSWSVYFRDDQVVDQTGEVVRYPGKGQFGPSEKFFCAVCGTTLFWRAEVFSGLTGVAGGSFPAGDLGEPSLSASDDRRFPWLRLPDTCFAQPSVPDPAGA